MLTPTQNKVIEFAVQNGLSYRIDGGGDNVFRSIVVYVQVARKDIADFEVRKLRESFEATVAVQATKTFDDRAKHHFRYTPANKLDSVDCVQAELWDKLDDMAFEQERYDAAFHERAAAERLAKAEAAISA